ncbi:transcriptional corepressor of histone-like protein genes [Lophiotrema nucula]|uniref:Histone transcription regulator 3 homolog n=1 Tax=Lophiotrema nucula TaxID=690887 RepID=A0A6A5YX06_9PLEO|nr:transcriptional corepressor of histone-like protein genes [Lophiotrema nucula]
MSNFRALNVESDNESEDEIDNTKEIQIEDALKLYQTALQYHAEGPASFARAAEAYKALFESDIFKYPESLSEYRRHELYGDNLVFDSILQEEFDAGPVQLAGGNESAPSTLPQILHLSYKNHGQFMLEMMQHWAQQNGAPLQQQRSSQIFGALQFFSEALDKEDTDLDLWLRTASVAALLGSRRITRYCLEAVLDGDDELVDSILQLPGLEEGFAGQQLRELVTKLEDNVSLMQTPLSSMKRRKLSEALKKRLNPYPFAPLPSEVADPHTSATTARAPERIPLNASKWDWAGVGEVILHHFHAEQSGFIAPAAGSSINISIPPNAALEGNDPSPEPLAIEDSVNVTKEAPVSHEGEGVPSTRQESEVQDTAKAYRQDVVMEEDDQPAAAKTGEASSTTPQDSASGPSRKRSTDSAGLPETAEGGRVRSKRLRARESVTEHTTAESVGPDPAKQLEEQLQSTSHADKCLFEIVNDSLERLGVVGLGSPDELRRLVTTSGSSAADDIDRVACDMYGALQSGAQKVAAVWLSNEPVDLGGPTREAGLNAFLGNAKSSISQTCQKSLLGQERLTRFAQKINADWLCLKEVAYAWLEMLLLPGMLPTPTTTGRRNQSSYMGYRWAEDLKRHLVQIIVNFDDYIYESALDHIAEIEARMLKLRTQSEGYSLSASDESQIEMIETIFELHLDIYSLIKHPHSGVDHITQTLQGDRLERWAALARTVMQLRTECRPDTGLDELALRHIWASVFQLSVNEDVDPEYVLLAMEELKTLFKSVDGRIIEVQNNAVMPELSIAAIDRELARIGMKDFFLKVFDQDEKDPVAVIESLEPILEPVQNSPEDAGPEPSNNDDDHADSRSPSTVGHPPDLVSDTQALRLSPRQEMRKFLDTASVPLRLSLWQRLREAYEAIEYPPKVLSCYLRTMEILVAEFKTPTFKECSPQDRHFKVLSKFRVIDEVLIKSIQIIRSEKTAFDCLTYEHLQSSMSAISELLRVMSAANFLEDLIKIGHLPAPRFEGVPSGTFLMITSRLHDMQLRTWTLQYYLLKEGLAQNRELFPTPSEDLFEFLRHVHYATGVRGFCHLANRIFLRLAKDELLRLDDVIDGETRDTEFAQLLNDLYGLKAFDKPGDCHDFGSVPEVLDKRTALQLLPFMMSQARKISIKDLPKTDLKTTIDKVHGCLGRPKPNEDITMNRKMLTAYFKSPVNPISLFDCLKGVGSLSTKRIPEQSAVAASQGWYFLMGNISLNKFRSQKRLLQVPTEDLNFAQAFFMQDLEYSVERWETWYRLAQAHDSQLEDSVLWNADKINSNSVELINYQRAAIHCYVMAVASAVRTADASSETMTKLSEMYTDFGNRVYASTREPFGMSAFNFRDNEHKFFSGNVSQIVYQMAPFRPILLSTAWKFAGAMYTRAIRANPDKWWNYYMLAKCRWKMYCAGADDAMAAVARGESPRPYKGPTWEDVIESVVAAIDSLPEKRGSQQPVLEPHYKLAVIVHKLFQRKAIDHEKAKELLDQTPYSQNIGAPENADDWERYILAVLKALRAADKSGWHHRIIARSAQIVYDDGKEAMLAFAAKNELTDRIFTKTMAVQVWKPENERPGRHFVYTSRYTRFFVSLLVQTGDKLNLEALARRVRRKTADFFEHSRLWQDLCLSYLKLLRRTGKIPDGHEDAVFKAINNEEFQVRAARLEAWCQTSTSQNPVLDVLRDVIELKRLNNGVMKPLLIDDLIGDTYALLYEIVGSSLEPLPSEQQQPLPPQPQHIQPQPMATGLGQPPPGPMQMSSMVHVQVDGAQEGPHNPNLPFSLYHPSQLQGGQQTGPQPMPQPDTTSRPRAKAVGRREIQRKAESCTAKAPATMALPTNMPIRSPPTLNAQIPPISSRISPEKTQPEPSIPAAPTSEVHLQPSNSGTATAAASASVSIAENSAPASVHDDADDESELSELDEDEVQEIGEEAGQVFPSVKPLFPKLTSPNGVNKSEEQDTTGDSSNVSSRAGSVEVEA